MYEIFEQLLLKFNTTAYRVGKETNIAASTFSDWKNGRSVPKQEKLERIAKFFGVTVDYLIGNTSNENKNCIEVQDSDERELLLLCRKVGDISKKDRDELISIFKNNIDFYLKTKGQ